MPKKPALILKVAVEDIDQTRTYTVKEVAALLNISSAYMRDLIHTGRIEAVKPTGGHFRITGIEVKRLLRGVSGTVLSRPSPRMTA